MECIIEIITEIVFEVVGECMIGLFRKLKR